ncbi:hypothetical protein HY638_01930 [Candidatus Woesearchaeota archaeon]|nr:hypothetical protein [Candidatus Woesearchaeota archaeon]
MKKPIIAMLFSFIALIPLAHAHCPLCTAAVGAAAVSANYYGLDISIIGIFVGAFAISTGLWVARMLKKEYIKYQTQIIVLLSFLLTVIPLLSINKESIYIPLLLAGEAGSVLNKVYFVNKLFVGSLFGAILSFGALWIHFKLKEVKGRVLFPFQGIVITLAMLALGSLGIYFL